MTIRKSGRRPTVGRGCRSVSSLPECRRMRRPAARRAPRQQETTWCSSLGFSSPCVRVYVDCTPGKLDSDDCDTGRLHVCQTSAAAFSLDPDVERAAADAQTGGLEAIHSLRKQWIERDLASIRPDRETEH